MLLSSQFYMDKHNKKNHFPTWPGLTSSLVTKHLPPSAATIRGHIHKQRQSLQSTKSNNGRGKAEREQLILPSNFPLSLTPNTKGHQVAYVVLDKNTLKTAYHDLTGRFPVRSSQGNEYVMIGYHYDANSILARPL